MSAPRNDAGPTLLMNLIVAFLTPMFLWSSGGDADFARLAAIETLNAYRSEGHRSLITAAKVIAFELAALSSLSLSMSDDVSESMVLRLRGNANSMDRAAERNRLALEDDRRDSAIVAGAGDLTEESVAASVAEAQRMVRDARTRMQAQSRPPVPTPASVVPAATADRQRPPVAAPVLVARTPRTDQQQPPVAAEAARAPMSDQQRRTAWATAMTEVAAEFTANLANLSPAERAKEMIRAEALTRTASALVSGAG